MDNLHKLAELNLYNILKVHPECSKKELKHKFNKLAKKYHPDRGGDEEKYKLIVEAFNILSNPSLKRKYDGLHNLYKKNILDHNDLKNQFSNFTSNNNLTPQEIERQKVDSKKLFAQETERLNKKHGFVGNDIGIPTQEASNKLKDLKRERNIYKLPHDNLFEGRTFIGSEFNAAFEQIKKRKKNTELQEYKGISAVNSVSNYAPLKYDELYTDTSNSSTFGSNNASLNEAFVSEDIIKTSDINFNEINNDYSDHNILTENTKQNMKKKMEEYRNNTRIYDNYSMRDFKKDNYGEYGIFDKLIEDELNNQSSKRLDNNTSIS